MELKSKWGCSSKRSTWTIFSYFCGYPIFFPFTVWGLMFVPVDEYQTIYDAVFGLTFLRCMKSQCLSYSVVTHMKEMLQVCTLRHWPDSQKIVENKECQQAHSLTKYTQKHPEPLCALIASGEIGCICLYILECGCI